MVAGRPWYQRNPADFIMAVRGFELELVGAYSLFIDHLNDRDRRLPDDDRLMAGLMHCSVRKWRKLREELIAQRKIVVTDDAYLTNPRFERERARRAGDEEQAKLWGRAGGLISAARRAGQEELDLDAGWNDDAQPPVRARTESAEKTRDMAKQTPMYGPNSARSSQVVEPEPKKKPNEIKPPAQPPPQAPYAGAIVQSSEKKDSSHPIPETPVRAREAGPDPPPVGRLDDADLVELTHAICDAAGYRPISPGQIDRATAQVEEWRKQGLSFDELVLPTIEAMMINSSEPTRTLGRFKASVAHEFAKARALGKLGRAYRAPPVPPRPLGVEDDPDPRIAELRERLRKEVGDRTYDGWLKPTAIKLNGQGLTMITGSTFMADWVRTHFATLLAQTAKVENVEVRSA